MAAITLSRNHVFCTVIVQQYLALGVANNHPFRQLRHNRRQDIFFFL